MAESIVAMQFAIVLIQLMLLIFKSDKIIVELR